jgi:hypothetical protein
MPTPGYSLVISAVDNVDGVLNKINAKIAASQSAATKRVAAALAPWQKLGATIAQTGKLLGFDKGIKGIGLVSKGMTGIARGSLDAFRNVARIVEPLGIITGALTLGGMYKLISAWAEFGTQLQFSATRIGIGVSQLSALQGGAQLAGVSAGALTSGLQGLGQTLYDAAGGRNSQAVGMFQQLGVSWRKGANSAQSVADVLPQVADAIMGLKDPYAQAQAASVLFGGAAEDLLPFLRLGSKGIKQYSDMAVFYGVTNQKAAIAANDFRMAQVKLDLSVKGLTNSIAVQLAPVLVPLLTSMANWIALNRQWIATKIGVYVKEFSDWLKGIDWKAVETGADNVWAKIKSVVSALGGWETTGRDVLIFFATTWVAGMLAPIAAIALAIAGVTTSLVGIPLLFPLIASAIVAAGLADMFFGAGKTPPGVNPTGSADVPSDAMGTQTPAGVKTNAAILRTVMQSHGVPDASTAGIFGNLVGESTVDPTRQQAGGPGFGIAQWGPDRQADFKRMMGVDIHGSTMAQQSEFIWKELGESQNAALKASLMSGKLSPSQAALAFDKGFEKPKNLNDPNSGIFQRSLFANGYYKGLDPNRSAIDPQSVAMPAAGPDVTLPSSTNAALATLRGDQAAGKLDVNVKIQHDGSIKTTTQSSGKGVGNVRVDTPMQAHAA